MTRRNVKVPSIAALVMEKFVSLPRKGCGSVTTTPKIVQIVADSVTVDGDVVTTVVALLDDNTVIYTGTSEAAEWHRLPPVPLSSADLD